MPRPFSFRSLFVALAACSAIGVPAAEASPYAKGPAPTADVLAQRDGPYGVWGRKVADSATPGFGPATVWAPTAAPGETFGAVALSPGFLAPQWTLTWLAKRLASQGFVTIVYDVNSPFDQPASRGSQLLAALSYLVTKSAAKDLVDPSRQAVVGHSMGGGGALEAAQRARTLKAVVAIAPWDLKKSFPQVASPTLVIGATYDWIAPIRVHARPFFRSLAPELPKAYLELNIDHAAPINPVFEVSRATITWLKRFLDDDERYTPAICPGFEGVKKKTITAFQSTCGTGPLAAAAAS